MSIQVLEAGILDTVQDAGRYGHSALGINPGGAMDLVAAAAANYLVGNEESEAVIELHFPAAAFLFHANTVMAISGADLSPHINDEPVPVNTALFIASGAVLQFKKIKKGSRAYFAVKNGFALSKWLGSYSTNIKAKAGGMEGRALQKDDILYQNAAVTKNTNTGTKILPWHADIAEHYLNENVIRIIKGSEYNLLTECSHTIIEGNSFIISAKSDRMGYQLNGSPLNSQIHAQMISSAVTRGTVQLLPSGQLIILMADHQTTGGYPKIAQVISADLSKLAQLSANTSIRFVMVTMQEAESLLMKQYHHLQQLKNACTFRLQAYFQQHGIY